MIDNFMKIFDLIKKKEDMDSRLQNFELGDQKNEKEEKKR
jgi:hypothetical protein